MFYAFNSIFHNRKIRIQAPVFSVHTTYTSNAAAVYDNDVTAPPVLPRSEAGHERPKHRIAIFGALHAVYTLRRIRFLARPGVYL